MTRIAERVEEALRGREEEVRSLQAEGAPVVGTLAAFAPPFEIVEASGCIPYRILYGGSSESETRGLRYLKNEACSLLKGVFGGISSGDGFRPDAVVVGGACDQLRRAEEIFVRDFGIATFALDVPRAHRLHGSSRRFRAELEWLSRELCTLSGSSPPDSGRLCARVRTWNRARRTFLHLRREVAAGRIDGRDAIVLSRSLWILGPERYLELFESVFSETGTKPAAPRGIKLLLTGPPVLLEDDLVFRVLEAVGEAQITADVQETGTYPHSSPVREDLDPWEALAERGNRFPLGCGFKRPDAGFKEAVESALLRVDVDGIIFKSLSFCAPWNHQATRFRRLFPGPFLALEGDYSQGQESRIKTRLGAFLESIELRSQVGNHPLGGGLPPDQRGTGDEEPPE